jgi:peptide/nickel transport system permease protein
MCCPTRSNRWRAGDHRDRHGHRVGASLSFLGLGTKPPAPEWGSMLSAAIPFISNDWFLVALPGSVITLTVLAVTVTGRDIRRRIKGRITS